MVTMSDNEMRVLSKAVRDAMVLLMEHGVPVSDKRYMAFNRVGAKIALAMEGRGHTSHTIYDETLIDWNGAGRNVNKVPVGQQADGADSRDF